MFFKLAMVTLLATTVVAGKSSLQLGPELQAVADKLHDTCQAKFPTDAKTIEEAEGGNFKDDQQFICYVHCLYNEYDLVDQEGGMIWKNFDEVIVLFPEPAVKRLARMKTECQHIEDTTKGKDHCQRMIELNICFQKTEPEAYILF